MSTPDPVRAAAYLATRERLDAKKRTIKVKCVAPNRQCGKRCIPPDWKCRIKGEGTDAHSRVVSGDPLAGAASIARGRDRLFKGLRTGNVSEIQGGRASIARGIVKAVPGQNLQQKQELRKRVEGVLLPVATGLFAMWAVRQGHEGAKVLFPVYARGPARDIENAASTAVGFIFDRIPVYGPRRQAQRRFAAVQAQVLGRAARISVIGDPTVSTNNNNAFIGVSRQRVAGVTTAIRDSLNIRNENGTVQSTYSQFRSDILGNVLGATTKGKSVYAEPTTVNFMARQFGISTNTLGSPDSTARKNSLISAVSRQLNEAAESMRTDMRVRGLDVSNPDAVRTYINIAETAARRRLTGLSVDQQDQALSRFRDLTTELITTQRSTRTIAQRLFTETEDSFNTFFRDAAQQVREDTSPSLRVLQAGGPSPVRSALIGVAEQVKNRVGISAPIAGANHAELVLQRVYHENAVTGGYNARRRNTTWIATDSDIKYAAQDLGWDNQGGTTSAYAFLQRTGQFPNLAPPAANAGGQARSFGRAQQARSGRRPQTRAQRIASLMRQRRPDGTPVYATREAAEAAVLRAEARRGDAPEIELIRTASYLAARTDLKENPRLGKPVDRATSAGALHAPKVAA